MSSSTPATRTVALRHVLADEGFRLFFPLAALHAALWPFLWIALWSFDLPLARDVPPSLWHMQEMIVGSWGAALIGFLTTAVPEWTGTARLRGRALWLLAASWGLARIVGFLASKQLLIVAALADLSWLLALILYLCQISIQRRTDRLVAFIIWLAALAVATVAARAGMFMGDFGCSRDASLASGHIFLGLLGLALARITVPVTNHVLDPREETAPYRPHPGRQNLAPGLVALAIAGDCFGLSPAVSGYLWIAAGAGFLDRVAECFVGREAFRAEIAVLAGASALSGLGLLTVGASRLGASWGEAPGVHIALMGGLGLAVLAVLSIAGRFHTGQGLGLNWPTKAAFIMIIVGTTLRAMPEMGLLPLPPGPLHLLASCFWALAFIAWLYDYWPSLSRLQTDEPTC